MTKTYLKELRSGQGSEAKLFFDYYGLWLINKRISDLSTPIPDLAGAIKHQTTLLKNTFESTLTKAEEVY
jgi:hypothetical protein